MTNSTNASSAIDSGNGNNTNLVIAICVIGGLALIACCAMIGLQRWGFYKVTKKKTGEAIKNNEFGISIGEMTTNQDGSVTIKNTTINIVGHNSRSLTSDANSDHTKVEIGDPRVNAAIGGAAVNALGGMVLGLNNAVHPQPTQLPSQSLGVGALDTSMLATSTQTMPQLPSPDFFQLQSQQSTYHTGQTIEFSHQQMQNSQLANLAYAFAGGIMQLFTQQRGGQAVQLPTHQPRDDFGDFEEPASPTFANLRLSSAQRKEGVISNDRAETSREGAAEPTSQASANQSNSTTPTGGVPKRQVNFSEKPLGKSAEPSTDTASMVFVDRTHEPDHVDVVVTGSADQRHIE